MQKFKGIEQVRELKFKEVKLKKQIEFLRRKLMFVKLEKNKLFRNNLQEGALEQLNKAREKSIKVRELKFKKLKAKE